MEDQQQQGENGQNPNGQNPEGQSHGYHTHDASVVQSQMNNGAGDVEFDDNFPPGYRFKPRDKELVVNYLRRKILNEPLPPNRIKEVNLYQFNPETLAENYKPLGQNEWYFFTPREKKYKNGKRPNRAAGDGFWKATGADKPIKHENVVLAFKKALVFYMGKPPKGDKTDWIMHEYRLEGPPRIRTSIDDMRLDDWVLCRIYTKRNKDRSRSGLLPSRPLTPLSVDPGILDYQQSDTEFQDSGAIDMGVEGSTRLPKGSFMPLGPGGSGVINVSGFPNQGGIWNSYDNTLYHQNQFGNHNVPYSDGTRNSGMPNHNAPNVQGRSNPGMPNHNDPYSEGRLNPGMPIHNVSDSQGRLLGMPNHNVSVSDSQGRLPGFAQVSYNNPMGQSSAWTHHMIPTSNQNPNQAAEPSPAARYLRAYPHVAASNQNFNQATESSAAAERHFQAYTQHHMFSNSNQNSNEAAESSAAEAEAESSLQSMERNMKLEESNEYQWDEFLNDPSDENCFDPDVQISRKF